MLDDGLRCRVRQLVTDAGEAPGLDRAARERVLSFVRSQGASAVRRGRRLRIASWVAGPALAAAAVVVWMVGATVPNRERPSKSATAAIAEVEPARDCAGWSTPVAADAPFVVEAGSQRLNLGRLGMAAAPSSAQVRLTEVRPCETVFELQAGQLVVRADELGGGSLHVRAGSTRVSVKGTLFSVERQDDRVAVDVFEGVVAVGHDGREHDVSAGQRLTITGVGTARGSVAGPRQEAAVALLQGPKVIGLESLDRDDPEPAVPAVPRAAVAGTSRENVRMGTVAGSEDGDLLAQAERLRRSGDYAAARDLYARVGATSGATAEAALLALARMELSLGRTEAAREAAEVRRGRFGRGSLGPEAQWLQVRIHRQAGRDDLARQAAKKLVVRWPSSPQAAAAKRLLDSR